MMRKKVEEMQVGIDRNSRVIILTVSGGAGHLQAARAKEQEIRKVNPDAKIFKVDVMKEWVWKVIGINGIKAWDSAQKKGNIKRLEWLVRQRKYADILFWPCVFFRMLNLLFRENIERVIDTQVVGTLATIKAIRLYNKIKKKSIILEKVLVDLPTSQAKPFFDIVKELSKKDRDHLELITIEPLLDKEKSNDEFWQNYTNLSEKEITYHHYSIRDSFLRYGDKDRYQDLTVTLKTANPEEKSYMLDAANKGAIFSKVKENEIDLTIDKNDYLFTILLGSQPAYKATLSYVDKMIRMVRDYPIENTIHAFIFCSSHKPGKDSLLKQVSLRISREKNFPPNLTIIPVSYQTDEVIAPLFFRSDATCTRSGGQTTMELLHLMKGQIWIHSETPHTSNKIEELTKGIPSWEAGNALYLIQKKGASIMSPDSFEENFEKFLKKLIAEKKASSAQ